MDDLDNITIQAHVQIDKFKLVDPRPQTVKEPITVKIPTSPMKQIPAPPIITVNRPISPTSPNKDAMASSPTQTAKPTSPAPTVEKKITQSVSAPKIVKSSVGKSQTVPKPVPEPVESKGTVAQLNAIKNQMKMKFGNSHPKLEQMETSPVQPPTVKSPEPKAEVKHESTFDKIKKKVDFSSGLGSIEGSNQSVKDWSDSPERKTANIMAEIRKKISKKHKEDDKKEVVPEQKEIQVIP